MVLLSLYVYSTVLTMLLYCASKLVCLLLFDMDVSCKCKMLCMYCTGIYVSLFKVGTCFSGENTFAMKQLFLLYFVAFFGIFANHLLSAEDNMITVASNQ